MRRVIKYEDSKIVSEQLQYLKGNTVNNKKISDILLTEQKGFCAYTEEYFGRADAKEIEHFNPTLKYKNNDNYNNWFLVKRQWNSEKSRKWANYQPTLHPTSEDFEERVIYKNGDYICKNENDIEAKNIIALLKLDDSILANQRKKYIERKRDEISLRNKSNEDFFAFLISQNISSIKYIRAIKEEFSVDIWPLLP